MFHAINAENVYRAFVIDTDASGQHWVADKRGESVILSDRFATFAEAQREWSRRVEIALK